jgi:TolB-like protein/class 3 adenylate cyclase
MQEHRLTAIMFTDIVGYTAMMGKDERKTHELLRKNRNLHQALFRKYNGTLLKEIGDGMMASFSAASNAVYCALEIQRVCIKENIPLRIGIHQGEVLFENGDILGDGVNIASRIEQAADPGSIYISASVYNDIRNKSGIQTEFVEEKSLKNIEALQKIYNVDVEKSVVPELELHVEGKAVNIKWKSIVAVIIGLIAIVLTVLYVIPKFLNKSPEDLERSIAVLPFDNESADESNAYFVNGMMEDIRNNLAKIGDLRVISKTSTEKYRKTELSIKEIAQELDVAFLLEGTVQRSGNKIKIHAQLIEAKTDDHLWSETYLSDLNDIFKIQSEIAQAIANELYTVITPEELSIIETAPTSDITAYDIFLRARDQHNNYWSDNMHIKALENAITLYRRALDNDSTFARAYTGLAMAYWEKHFWENYFEPTLLDSVLVLVNKALSFDDRLDEAYFVRGRYYGQKPDSMNAAMNDMNMALELNPNYAEVYRYKSRVSAWAFEDYVNAIKNGQKAVNLDHGPQFPQSLTNLANFYAQSGFLEMGKEYYEKALLLDNDSINYYQNMSLLYFFSNEDLQGTYNYALSGYRLDSTNMLSVMYLLWYSSFLGMAEEANYYALKLIEIFNSTNARIPGIWHRIGYAFFLVNNPEQAEYYFNEQIEWSEKSIKLSRQFAQTYGAHYDLACVMSFKGETEKAIDLLKELNKRSFMPRWWITQFKYDPLLDPIRDDARFQKILDEIQIKYQKEHDRVKYWMESQRGVISP